MSKENSLERTQKIIGPTEREAAEVNALSRSIPESPWGKWGYLFPASLAIPVLAACSSQPPAVVRQVEAPPASPTSTPTAELTPTSLPKPTATLRPEACNPEEFAKKQGIPTPIPLGGGIEDPSKVDPLLVQVAAIGKKIENCQPLTSADLALIADFNQKYAPKTPEPASVTKPAATATEPPKSIPPQEVKNEVPCNILPQEYCDKGEFFDWTDQGGQTYRMVGFRLPSGVTIFSPIEGHLTKGKANVEPFSSGLQAAVTKVKDPLSTVFSFFGDLQFNNMFDIDVKKGEIVARTQSTGVKIIKDYNLIFTVTQRDPGRSNYKTPEELLKEYFPSAY